MHVWSIHPTLSQTEAVIGQFEKAVAENNISGILAVIKDPVNLRSFIVRRSDSNKAHKLIVRSFETLLKKACGLPVPDIKKDGGEFLKYLRANGIIEQFINEVSHAFYHQNDKDNFNRLIDYIAANKSGFNDKQVSVRAMHDLASWKSSRENDQDGAIKLNKKVIEEARKHGFKVLEQKAAFGLAHDKQIKHKNKITGFKQLESVLKGDLKNEYDALRGRIEMDKNTLHYARYKGGDFKKVLLEKAKTGALDSLKMSIKIGYKNAEIQSSRLLGEIYAELGDERKAKSYKKRAEKINEN